MIALRDSLGLTMIVVTHELHSIHAIADRVLMLDGGRVRVDGTLEEIAASSDPRVRRFFDRLPEPESHDSGALLTELTR
jgi:phospholipid/cholesterol/gamma-HCH transport system ATP-binding protein